MSLEQALAANTAALEANTAALTGGKAPAKSTGAKPAGKSTTGAKGVTVDQLGEAFGGFLNTGSAAAKKKAKLVVKGIVDNFGAARVTKIDPDDFKEAMALLKQYKDGDDPLELFESDDDDDDDDGMV